MNSMLWMFCLLVLFILLAFGVWHLVGWLGGSERAQKMVMVVVAVIGVVVLMSQLGGGPAVFVR